MNTGVKVVLWILGIVGGLFLLMVGAGIYFGRSMVGEIDEGRRFAATATHTECEGEFGKRVNDCDGMKCVLSTAVFVGACLEGAKGDVKVYCADIPASTEKSFSAWSGEFCARHNIGEKGKCEMAAGILSGACGAAQK